MKQSNMESPDRCIYCTLVHDIRGNFITLLHWIKFCILWRTEYIQFSHISNENWWHSAVFQINFFSLQFINHLNKNNDVFVCSMLLFTAYKTIIHSYDALYYKSIDYTALLHTCKFLFMPIHSSCKIMSTTIEIRKSEFLDWTWCTTYLYLNYL